MTSAAMKKWTPREWKNAFGWVTTENSTILQRNILARAWRDIGTVEKPLGSNRGTRIDEYLRRANVPESLITTGKGWWCAAWVGAMFIDAGALAPSDYASCDAWIPFVRKDPIIGAAILYGVRGNAHHIGIVVRLKTEAGIMLSIEGNRAFAGSSNNGVAVDLGPVLRTDVLGYIHPVLGA